MAKKKDLEQYAKIEKQAKVDEIHTEAILENSIDNEKQEKKIDGNETAIIENMIKNDEQDKRIKDANDRVQNVVDTMSKASTEVFNEFVKNDVTDEKQSTEIKELKTEAEQNSEIIRMLEKRLRTVYISLGILVGCQVANAIFNFIKTL